ncbi:phage minor head protein [Mesorhizobium sp. YIM 152430]|uniref:phage minor head protein n=1 Tax=Mesorhizobium sp. YIM 152430 TaxID=3031761 RepID=UPI0023D9CD9F|nr:phage minor head protein [Mesorhizobium sp. YIM 152430]MDF1599720.1 phage minor head protein [Mesorhizobium sp. YIM 152430]
MARRQTARQRLAALSAKFEPALQAAFLAAIDDLRNGVQTARVAERLERGDVDGALRALNVDPAAFRLFEEGIREAFIGGGIASSGAVSGLRDPSGGQLLVRFDARAPVAERFMQDVALRNVRLADDVIAASRQHMVQGLIDGRNPRSVALDMAGRINRATGRREGGILGLSSVQERYVATARQDLLSGDPERLRHYLKLGRRNKSYDRTITAAIRDGKSIPATKVQEIVGKLSDSYLLLRAETIARTETIGALNASHSATFDQLVADGKVTANQVRKIWRATRDSRTRDSHAALDGESVGKDERFSNGLMFPCEPGGNPSEICNCRCSLDYRVDWFANLT